MSILAKILADKGPEVEAARARTPLVELEARLAEVGPAMSLKEALRRRSDEPARVISEFKRASPSAGAICAGAQPEPVAEAYEKAGASAISVLTDVTYFDGRLEFLPRIRRVASIPLLRKDFIVDPYQVVEARANGADAILLIVRALEASVLGELLDQAAGLGMDSLVEVHDEQECEIAVAQGATLIGVNHRNLATFEIDLGLTRRLKGLVPEDAVLVGESGIRGRADVAALEEDGVHAVLVGETLMRAEDPGRALRELRGERL